MSEAPKYLRLARSFERQIHSGVLRVGDRLPSVRRLRESQQVSAATAVGCYVWLERQGYVRARPKSGYYVSRTPAAEVTLPAAGKRRGPAAVTVGNQVHDAPTDVIQMGNAVVSPNLLPMTRLNRSIRLALSAFADHAVRSEDPRGELRFRRQIARLMFRQGSSCGPDDVLVTSGVTEALNLAIRAVAGPGDVVAVETPGCFEILQALAAYRMRAIELPHEPGKGIDRESLARAARQHKLKAVFIAGSCHNPLGDCMADEHKAALVDLAGDLDLPIIESDSYGDLVFSGLRPRSLKSFDRAGVVMQCASFSHYVAPGFNLGWMSAGRWQTEVQRLKAFTNIASARLPQLALAEFLESGAFDQHLKKLRLALRDSVQAAREEVLRQFPGGTRVSAPAGGFVLWIELPPSHDGSEVERRAAAAGVRILPGSLFSVTGQYRNYIRIACGYPPDILKSAIHTLASLL